MYLGARIFQSLLRDGQDANLRSFLPWIDRFDQLCVASNNDKTLQDLISRLSGAVEVRLSHQVEIVT
jgi:hypothetical protein